MFAERVALLVAGKTVPQTDEEKILMKAYYAGIDGISLVRIYLEVSEMVALQGDMLSSFILGYSSGSAVLKFAIDQREYAPDESLN